VSRRARAESAWCAPPRTREELWRRRLLVQSVVLDRPEARVAKLFRQHRLLDTLVEQPGLGFRRRAARRTDTFRSERPARRSAPSIVPGSSARAQSRDGSATTWHECAFFIPDIVAPLPGAVRALRGRAHESGSSGPGRGAEPRPPGDASGWDRTARTASLPGRRRRLRQS
jgi:hypothetical protein